MSDENIAQNNAMHQKSGGNTKGNDVGERIEFPAKRTFFAAHARQAAIEQIKNTCKQDEDERVPNGGVIGMRLLKIRFDNTRQREESAKKIPSRHQFWQEIDL